MAKKKRKIREVLAAFAASVTKAQLETFKESLLRHYQSLSPVNEDLIAPNYRMVFEKIMETVEGVAPTEIATFRYAPETVAAPMTNEVRDLCAEFYAAAQRYCKTAFRSRFFSDDFQDAFNKAIIVHYSTFGASAFVPESGHFPYLADFAKTVRKELRTQQGKRKKETLCAFDGDVVAPDAPPSQFPSLAETWAFLESLKSRKFDSLLIALFGSARDGLAYLNPDADPALKRALERERCKLRELLDKRFPADDK
ncbi:MAG: hypothetical protein IKK39_07935 [Thermoguttaceae bacterium]|nr:hypothetical protein [Thermoguttaceae bacterium]MBR4103976.1 hypothetical protein [Thermoguttaceae bacterium]